MKGTLQGSLVKLAEGKWPPSLLAPLLILIYVNNLPDESKYSLNMFVDDAKIMKSVSNLSCNNITLRPRQKGAGSVMWLISFSDKCNVSLPCICQKTEQEVNILD